MAQWIPSVVLLVLFLINLTIKQKLFCLSSMLLLYESLMLACSVYFSYDPRVGVPFVSENAMWFLSATLSLLFGPLLFLRDHRLCVDGVLFRQVSASYDYGTIARGLLIALLPISIFFFFRGFSGIQEFFVGGGDREAFRETLDTSIMSNPIMAFCWFFGACFYCALFWCVCGLLFWPTQRSANLMLMFAGSLWMFDGIRTVSRSNIFYSIVFVVSVCLVLRTFFSGKKMRIPKICVCLLLLVCTLFVAITIFRFGSNSKEERGVGYNAFAYFSSGPYCFNADYELRSDGEVPPLNGFLTAGLGVRILDRFFSDVSYAALADLHEEYYTPNTEIHRAYQELCETFSGEFKTMIGTFILDYSPSVVLVVFTALFLGTSFLMWRLRPSRLSDALILSVYVYVLLTSNIGFVFGTFRGNMALMGLMFFWCCLRIQEKLLTGGQHE